jgi:NTP pyrophosphatase (non-canonical NTP hydrolase)
MNYLEFVAAKIKSGEAIREGLTDPTDFKILHEIIGISLEVFETMLIGTEYADEDSTMIEELGDLGFFIVAIALSLAKKYNFELTYDLFDKPCEAADAPLAFLASFNALADRLKKSLIHKKEMDVSKLRQSLALVFINFGGMINEFGFTTGEVRDHNMNKLSARYPSGTYSDEQAQARADK